MDGGLGVDEGAEPAEGNGAARAAHVVAAAFLDDADVTLRAGLRARLDELLGELLVRLVQQDHPALHQLARQRAVTVEAAGEAELEAAQAFGGHLRGVRALDDELAAGRRAVAQTLVVPDVRPADHLLVLLPLLSVLQVLQNQLVVQDPIARVSRTLDAVAHRVVPQLVAQVVPEAIVAELVATSQVDQRSDRTFVHANVAKLR